MLWERKSSQEFVLGTKEVKWSFSKATENNCTKIMMIVHNENTGNIYKWKMKTKQLDFFPVLTD